MMRCRHGRFPHTPLLLLAIAHDAKDTVRLAVHLGGHCHAHGHPESLTQRAGTRLKSRQARLETRMPLQTAAQLTQGQHLLFGEITCRRQCRIQHRSRMSYGQHHLVAFFPVGTFWVVTQMVEIQNGKDIHQVERAARMSRACLRQGGQYQLANMLRLRFQLIHINAIKSLTIK